MLEVKRNFLEKYSDILEDLVISKFTVGKAVTIEFDIDNQEFLKDMLTMRAQLTYIRDRWILKFIDVGEFALKGPKYIQDIQFKLDILESKVEIYFCNKWRTLKGGLLTSTDRNTITFNNW